MDLRRLKSAEACWNLSDQRKAMLVDQIYNGETAPRRLSFSFLKPIFAISALAAVALALLLAWPKKPPEETIVTLPGASQEALPDDYVPSENKEPVTQNTEKEDPAKKPTEEKEPGVVTTPEKEESPSVSFADAYGVAKDKAYRKNFNKELTDSQREALKVYLTAENFAYLQGQVDGNITAFKEVGSKQYNLDIWLFTPESAVGKDLTAGDPLTLSGKEVKLTKLDSKVLDLPEVEGNLYFYPRLMAKEIQKSEEYLQNVTFGSALPEGRMRLRLQLSSPLSKENVRELVAHYLGHEKVTWIELSYHVEEDTSNPTAIHRFWETQKEMPFEEARAIVVEKATRRFNEKLSDKERMAYYVVITDRVEITAGEMYDLHLGDNDPNSFTSFTERLRIMTLSEGIGLKPSEDFHAEKLNLNGGIFSYDIVLGGDTEICSPENHWRKEDQRIDFQNVNGETNILGKDYSSLFVQQEGQFFTEFTFSGAKDPSMYNPREKNNIFKEVIRHHLSIDCVTWVDCSEAYFWFEYDD